MRRLQMETLLAVPADDQRSDNEMSIDFDETNWPGITSCTLSVRKIASIAYFEGLRFNDLDLRPEHLLLAIGKLVSEEFRCNATDAFSKLGLDPRKVRLEAEKLIPTVCQTCTRGPLPNPETMELLRAARRHSLRLREVRANELGCGSGGLLLALVDYPGTIAKKTLTTGCGIGLDDVSGAIQSLLVPEP